MTMLGWVDHLGMHVTHRASAARAISFRVARAVSLALEHVSSVLKLQLASYQTVP
jgi:hypothetical protein